MPKVTATTRAKWHMEEYHMRIGTIGFNAYDAKHASWDVIKMVVEEATKAVKEMFFTNTVPEYFVELGYTEEQLIAEYTKVATDAVHNSYRIRKIQGRN